MKQNKDRDEIWSVLLLRITTIIQWYVPTIVFFRIKMCPHTKNQNGKFQSFSSIASDI